MGNENLLCLTLFIILNVYSVVSWLIVEQPAFDDLSRPRREANHEEQHDLLIHEIHSPNEHDQPLTLNDIIRNLEDNRVGRPNHASTKHNRWGDPKTEDRDHQNIHSIGNHREALSASEENHLSRDVYDLGSYMLGNHKGPSLTDDERDHHNLELHDENVPTYAFHNVHGLLGREGDHLNHDLRGEARHIVASQKEPRLNERERNHLNRDLYEENPDAADHRQERTKSGRAGLLSWVRF
ncbi:uncharacterized protein LOC142987798 [Anticarsia gemmatalis]|uniref:uncharacterized protein LOC142987798 n=1 Tax=Anticarsia gemmatalis TaxID=129554 RepID=UPI003F766710